MKVCFYDLCMDDEYHPVLQETRSIDVESCIWSAADVAEFFEKSVQLSRHAEEYVYILCMNTTGRVIGVFEVGHGTCRSTVIDRRGIAIRMLLCGASNVIFVHNHPGGSLEFSSKDLDVIDKLRELCELLGVNVSDSIIVSPEGYTGYLATFCEEL